MLHKSFVFQVLIMWFVVGLLYGSWKYIIIDTVGILRIFLWFDDLFPILFNFFLTLNSNISSKCGMCKGLDKILRFYSLVEPQYSIVIWIRSFCFCFCLIPMVLNIRVQSSQVPQYPNVFHDMNIFEFYDYTVEKSWIGIHLWWVFWYIRSLLS